MTVELSTAPNIVVEALAGTGKTFAMTNGIRLMHWLTLPKGLKGSDEQQAIWTAMQAEGHPGTCHLTSFSTDATAQLKKNLPEGVTASSTYGMGFSAAKKSGIAGTKSEYKYFRIMSDYLGGRWKGEAANPGLTKTAVGLCEKARLSLKRVLSGEELKTMADHYGVEVGNVEQTTEAVNHLLKEGLKQSNVFDYTDMVWIPVLKNLIQKKYDHLVVDEYQDMGIAQQEICYRSARRVLAIGDENQAIYGFIGADSNAAGNFRIALRRTGRGLETFSLTVTRRCCKAVVRKANELVSGLRAMEGAPEGLVDRKARGFSPVKGGGSVNIGPKDMVICPTNAPLVSLLFQLVKAGAKAYVRKSDVVDQMRTYVSEFTKGIGELRIAIKRNIDRLEEQRSTRTSRAGLDKYRCLEEVANASPTITDVGRALATLFVDDNRPGATRLSSVHRSKGLEADHVWFWNWNLCGQYAEQPCEKVQARNLQYVGFTRAKTHLTLVDGEAL